jgi:hypothetical protein
MNKNVRIVCGVVLGALCVAAPAIAQETREQAIAGMRKMYSKEMDPTYTKVAPFAQKVVEEALAHEDHLEGKCEDRKDAPIPS